MSNEQRRVYGSLFIVLCSLLIQFSGSWVTLGGWLWWGFQPLTPFSGKTVCPLTLPSRGFYLFSWLGGEV
jgi:hypothetical protein